MRRSIRIDIMDPAPDSAPAVGAKNTPNKNTARRRPNYRRWYAFFTALVESGKDQSFKPLLDYLQMNWKTVKGATVPILTFAVLVFLGGYWLGGSREKTNDDRKTLITTSERLAGIMVHTAQLFILRLQAEVEARYYHRLSVIAGTDEKNNSRFYQEQYLRFREKTEERARDMAVLNEERFRHLDSIKRICPNNKELIAKVASVYKLGFPEITRMPDGLNRAELDKWRTQYLAAAGLETGRWFATPMEELITALAEEIKRR